ncbi:antitoxin VbhA family protein [Nocardia asteroides]
MATWAAKFPTEFKKLTDEQARALEGTLASHALEGLTPDKTFVANLVAVRTGTIDRAEYLRRAKAWSASKHRVVRAAG